MEAFLLQHQTLIRLGTFLSILFIMGLWEIRNPRRFIPAKTTRWLNNLALVVLNSILVRLCFSVSAVGVALWATTQQWGVFNLLALPEFLKFLLALICLDLAIYAQHVACHQIPLLWRLHRVHHIDTAIDVSTGLRFHSLEIILSMLFKYLVIILIGAPASAVLIFEVVLNGMAMFNHSNISLPPILDKYLRTLIVTPDFHRVHHSVIPQETNSNYGFNLSLWDYVFKTYIPQPAAGHQDMQIGLYEFRAPHFRYLPWLLLIPFLTTEPKTENKNLQ